MTRPEPVTPTTITLAQLQALAVTAAAAGDHTAVTQVARALGGKHPGQSNPTAVAACCDLHNAITAWLALPEPRPDAPIMLPTGRVVVHEYLAEDAQIASPRDGGRLTEDEWKAYNAALHTRRRLQRDTARAERHAASRASFAARCCKHGVPLAAECQACAAALAARTVRDDRGLVTHIADEEG